MSQRNFSFNILLLAVVLSLASPVFAHSVHRTQISRYASVANTPTAAQVNPLVAVSQFRFGLNVQTVGDAVTQVLRNTGYTLAPVKQLSSNVQSILGKPLPITQRKLGPLSIKTTLTVLMGQQVVQLIEDPVHRIVTFRLNSRIKRALTHGEHHHEYHH